MKILWVALLASLPAIALAGEGKPDAKAVYAAKCASCHGKDGKGSAAMAKMFKVELASMSLAGDEAKAKKDDELVEVVAKGKGKMPAYAKKLSGEEIAAVVAYSRGLGAAEKPRQDAKPAADGAGLYAAKCSSCHAKNGKGGAPLAKMFGVAAEALDLTRAAAERKDDELSAVISDGKNKMPAFKEKLKETEIRAVVAYIRSLAG